VERAQLPGAGRVGIRVDAGEQLAEEYLGRVEAPDKAFGSPERRRQPRELWTRVQNLGHQDCAAASSARRRTPQGQRRRDPVEREGEVADSRRGSL